MNETIIFLSEITQLKYLFKYLKSEKKYQIITFKDYIENLFDSYEIKKNIKINSYRDLNLDHKNWESCSYEAVKILQGWNKIEINGKSVFKEILSLNGISLLELDSIRYLSSHSEFLANLIFKVSIIEEIIRKLNPTKLIFLYPQTEWEIIGRSLYSKSNINIKEKNKLYVRLGAFINKNTVDFKLGLKNFKLRIKVPIKILPIIYRLNLLRTNNNTEIYKKIKKVTNHKIIFYLDNVKFFDVILPLINTFKVKNYFCVVIIPRYDIGICKILEEERINYIILNSNITKKINKKAFMIYFNIIKKYEKVKKNRYYIEKILRNKYKAFEKIIFQELSKTFYLSKIKINYYFLINKIIHYLSPALLITTNIPLPITQILIKACRTKKMLIVGIESSIGGLITEYSLYGDLDLLFIAGNYARKSFINFGFDEKKIKVTGIPIFNDLLKKLSYRDKIKERTFNFLNYNPSFEIVTYLTQSDSVNFGFIEKINEIKIVFKTIKKFNNIFLVIKLHPSEDKTEIYRKIAQKENLRNYCIIKNEVPLDDILISSKIALTKNSTTGFNALIANCKLIVLGFHDKSFRNNYFANSNSIQKVINQSELLNVLNDYLKTESKIEDNIKKKFLEKYIYKLDKRSTNRIEKHLSNLITYNEFK